MDSRCLLILQPESQRLWPSAFGSYEACSFRLVKRTMTWPGTCVVF
jgi:hypothetical protein